LEKEGTPPNKVLTEYRSENKGKRGQTLCQQEIGEVAMESIESALHQVGGVTYYVDELSLHTHP
jgi:hypothetical protein